MGMITFRGFTQEDTIILGTNGEDCIVAALWCLIRKGPEEHVNEAFNLLRHLGKAMELDPRN